MRRMLGFLAVLAALAAVPGCRTAEMKGQGPVGLVDGAASGSQELGYGAGKGDSMGLPGPQTHKETTDASQESH